MEAKYKSEFELTKGTPYLTLTHWGRVTHICVSKLPIVGSDNGLSPDRRQAIIWTNAGILLIGPLGTNFSEISIEILTFSFKEMHSKVSSAKRQPFCVGLNVLMGEIWGVVCWNFVENWLRYNNTSLHHVNNYMLNYFEETWIYICILHHSMTFKEFKWLKFYLLGDKSFLRQSDA